MKPATRDDDEAEKPLDPAIERVRQRLLRFVVINLALLFTAVIIVVAAVVYRAATKGDASTIEIGGDVPSGEAFDATVEVPAGGRLTSQSLSGQKLSLSFDLPDGRQTVIIYDMAARRVVAHLALQPQ